MVEGEGEEDDESAEGVDESEAEDREGEGVLWTVRGCKSWCVNSAVRKAKGGHWLFSHGEGFEEGLAAARGKKGRGNWCAEGDMLFRISMLVEK